MTAGPLRLAALDIGTNSVRLLGLEAGVSGPPRILVDTGQVTRLGAALVATGAIADADLLRTKAAVRHCIAAGHAAGITSIEVVGTEVFRAATNGVAAAEALSRAAGHTIRILSEREEGEASYLGVAAWPGDAPTRSEKGCVLVLDVGGGSSEITMGQQDAVLATLSLPVGALRVTEEFLLRDPPDAGDLEAACLHLARSLRAVDPTRFRLPGGGPHQVVGVGGTACAIGAAVRHVVPYDPARVNGATVTPVELDSALRDWAAVPLAERTRRWGLEEGRAGLVVGGALIFRVLMEQLELGRFEVSTRGLRHGLLIQAFQGLGDSD